MERKIIPYLLIMILFAAGCNNNSSYQPEETKAKFLLEQRSYEVGETIVFNNISAGYRSVFWDFDDGNNSTEISPIHSYTKPGDYNPRLTISGNNKTLTYEYKISISGDPLIENEENEEVIENVKVIENELTYLIKFTFSDTIAAIGKQINFKSDTTIEFTWDLNNDNIVKAASGEVAYSAAGNKLITISENNSESILFSQNLHIYNATVSPTSINPGEVVKTNAYSDFEVKWKTQDGRIFEEKNAIIPFQNAGNTSVQLLVSETDSILETHTITVNEALPKVLSIDIDKMLNSLANAGLDRTAKDKLSKELETLCRYGTSTPVTGELPGDLDQLIIKLRMEASKYVRMDIKTNIKVNNTDKIESIKILQCNTKDID